MMKLKLNKKIFTILSLLAILSLAIIIKYYFLQGIDILKNIEVVNKNNESLFLDLSIGYIVSYIFYIIQIVMPEYIKKKKYIEGNKTQLTSIINDLKESFLCIDYYYKIENNGDIEFNCNDGFLIIKLLNDKRDNVYWCTDYTLKDLIGENNIFNIICNKIIKVKEDPLLESMDIEFIILLNKIEKNCETIKKILSSITLNTIQNKYESIELYDAISKLKKECTEFYDYGKFEKNEYEVATGNEITMYKICKNKQHIKPQNNSKLYIKIDFNNKKENINV